MDNFVNSGLQTAQGQPCRRSRYGPQLWKCREISAPENLQTPATLPFDTADKNVTASDSSHLDYQNGSSSARTHRILTLLSTRANNYTLSQMDSLASGSDSSWRCVCE